MTNKETKNVYNDEKTAIAEKKAKGLIDFLNEEPKARIIPVLKVTEMGIIPDAKIILVEDKTDSDEQPKSNGKVEGGDSSETGGGEGETSTTESTESQG